MKHLKAYACLKPRRQMLYAEVYATVATKESHHEASRQYVSTMH
jgi:hypothetical protein